MKSAGRKVLAGILFLMLAVVLLPVVKAKGDDIPTYDLRQGNVSVTGSQPVVRVTSGGVETGYSISINTNTDVTVFLKDVNIKSSDTPIDIQGSGNVTLLLEGENTLEVTEDYSGIYKNNTGSLNISTEGNQTAILNVISSAEFEAGIGGRYNESVSDITFSGYANVTVNMNGNNNRGAGIGGGGYGSGSNITFSDNAQVTVNMNGDDNYGAGIGGGKNCSASDITITDNASVTVNMLYDDNFGAGIGGGDCDSGENITVSDQAQVTVYMVIDNNFGAGIGGGKGGSGSNLSFYNHSQITVNKSGANNSGAGIGGGASDSGENITVSDYARVIVHMNNYGNDGAGIGGGGSGDCTNVNISDNASVIVNMNSYGNLAAGIGGGITGDCTNVTISDNTSVIALGKLYGAAIGGGDWGACTGIKIFDSATVRVRRGKSYIGGCNKAEVDIEFTNPSHPFFTGAVIYYDNNATLETILAGTAQTVNKLTLSYKANGGTGDDIEITKFSGDVVTLQGNSYTKNGKHFAEWNTASNGTGTSYDPGDQVTLTGDLTLYAIWEDHTYNKSIVNIQYFKSAADCTNAAVYYKSCQCGACGTDNDTFTSGNPLGHDYQDVPNTAVAPTCTSTGHENNLECTRCHDVIQGATINTIPHTYDREEVDAQYLKTPANCTHAAVYYKSCQCGAKGTDNDTFTSGDPSGQHNYQEKAGTAITPTCTLPGKEADLECTFCHDVIQGATINMIPHTYDREEVNAQYLKSSADCTHAAVYHKSCECGACGTDNDTFTVGDPLGHDYQAVPGTATTATCTSAGKEEDQKCSRCQDVIQGATIQKLPHTYNREVATGEYLKSSAGCTHAAEYYKSCECGAKGTEIFTVGSPLGHEYRDVPNTYVYPTCTSNGKYADQRCIRCNDVITGSTITKLPHTYDREVAVGRYLKSAADCTHAAEYYKSCECGATGNDTFTVGSALGHDYKEVEGSAVAYTCTKEGKEADRECTRCHNVVKGATIEKLPHTFDKKVVSDKYLKTAADCTHVAVYYMSCKCGEKGTKTFEFGEALGHDYKEVPNSAVAASCTAEGKEADKECTRCHDVIKGAAIAKLPHNYDKKVATDQFLKTAADCTHAAVYYMSCVCGEKGTKTFTSGDPLGHDYKEIPNTAVSPTCVKDGKEADMECTLCHDIITGKTIPKTGEHKWKAATGYAPKTCEVCGLTEGDVVRYSADASGALEHKLGKNTSLTITYHRSEDDGSLSDHFRKVIIDGKEMDATIDPDTNTVTISPESLNTLDPGTYSVKVVFDDWTDELKIKIVGSSSPAEVVIPVAIVAVLAAAGSSAVILIRKRRAAGRGKV